MQQKRTIERVLQLKDLGNECCFPPLVVLHAVRCDRAAVVLPNHRRFSGRKYPVLGRTGITFQNGLRRNTSGNGSRHSARVAGSRGLPCCRPCAPCQRRVPAPGSGCNHSVEPRLQQHGSLNLPKQQIDSRHRPRGKAKREKAPVHRRSRRGSAASSARARKSTRCAMRVKWLRRLLPRPRLTRATSFSPSPSKQPSLPRL